MEDINNRNSRDSEIIENKSSKPKITGEKLQKVKANYHSIFNQASDAIYICDINGNFLDFNESFCRTFGYTAEEFQHLTILHLMEPEELKARPIQFALVATGQHLFGQRRMVKKSGEILDMEINIKMYEENCVLAIARDVTELRNTQKMIQISEERFRGAFEHSAIGMALVSLKGEWLKVNKELCNMVGYTEQELLLLTFQQITHPDDLEKDLGYVQQTLDGIIEFYRMEKRYFHKNGSLVWINLNVSVVKDAQSQPLYFVSQIENISERKRSEEALKKSEANLQAIFDTTDTAYALVDNDLSIISYNKCAADFAEKEIGAVVKPGEPLVLSNYFREDRKPFIEKAIPEVLKGKHVVYETSYPQADGSIHWYYVRLYPIASTEQEVHGLMLAIDNITKRKQSELQKEKIANDLIIRNKDLEHFTHIVSHHVRSPIARLMGLSNLLIDYNLSDKEKSEIVSGISESAKELDNVVRDLNDILQYKN